MGRIKGIFEDIKYIYNLITGKHGTVVIVIAFVLGFLFIQKPVDEKQTALIDKQARMDARQMSILENISKNMENVATKSDVRKAKNELSIDIIMSEKRGARNLINSNRVDDKDVENERLEEMILDLDKKLDHMYPRLTPKEPNLLNENPIKDTTMAFILEQKIYN